jgi:hypothetical protein
MSNHDDAAALRSEDAPSRPDLSSPTRGGTLRWGDSVGPHASPTRGGTLRGLHALSPAEPAVDAMRTPAEMLRALNDALVAS